MKNIIRMKYKEKLYMKIVQLGSLSHLENSYPDIYRVHEGARKIDTAAISALPSGLIGITRSCGFEPAKMTFMVTTECKS